MGSPNVETESRPETEGQKLRLAHSEITAVLRMRDDPEAVKRAIELLPAVASYARGEWDCREHTLVEYAVAWLRTESVRVLIRAGAPMNDRSVLGKTEEGWPPIATLALSGERWATKAGLEITDMVLSAGADPDVPVHLLVRGSDLDPRIHGAQLADLRGVCATPLWCAAKMENRAAFDLLLRHGADPHLHFNIEINEWMPRLVCKLPSMAGTCGCDGNNEICGFVTEAERRRVCVARVRALLLLCLPRDVSSRSVPHCVLRCFGEWYVRPETYVSGHVPVICYKLRMC
jgi:hypothetical protein